MEEKKPFAQAKQDSENVEKARHEKHDGGSSSKNASFAQYSPTLVGAADGVTAQSKESVVHPPNGSSPPEDTAVNDAEDTDPESREPSSPTSFSPRPPVQEVKPGAVAVDGIDGPSNAHDFDDYYYGDGDSQGGHAADHATTAATGSTGVTLTSAVLVDPDDEERKLSKRLEDERKGIPMAEPLVAVPWWRRPSTIFSVGIICVIVVVVSIVVPLSNQNSADANAPAFSPTISPAPTALALITLVLQLDDKPWETGWELECDEGVIQSAPPGTYALVTGRPNFRVETQEVVTVGTACRLTILDTGGDGLVDGYYAIYYGNDVGDQASLISGGTVSGSESIITFFPGETASPLPTAAPTISSGTTEPIGCTVCPDGSTVRFPDAPAQGWATLTCSELDFLAAIQTNPAICRNMQDAAAFGCGCKNFCTTMCPDRISDIDPANADDVVFIQNNEQVTCDEYQTSIETDRANSQDQCLSANFIGEDVCGCPTTGPFCRICEATAEVNSIHNPPLDGFETEIVPGVNCLDITGIAYTLKRDDPRTGFFQLCPACLSIGAYCGCAIPEENGREFCRLCGGPQDLLWEPSRIIESSILGYNTTCYHLEFLSNINDDSTLPCEEYRADGTEACCS